jgi:hypothetical protein
MPDRSTAKRSDGSQQQRPVQETVTAPMRTMTTAAERVPGAERVRGVFEDMLNTVGIVSPRARRVAAYTGAGVLGVAGLVEWPVAVVGAAAVWLTQPRPADTDGADTGAARTERRRTKQAASSSGNGSRTARKRSGTSTAKRTATSPARSTAKRTTTSPAKSTAKRTSKSTSKSTAKRTTSASRAKAGGQKKA